MRAHFILLITYTIKQKSNQQRELTHARGSNVMVLRYKTQKTIVMFAYIIKKCV